MSFLDYLKSRLFGNVSSVDSNGFENKKVEVNADDNYSQDSRKQRYWKEFYLPDGTHVSRHGDDKEFEGTIKEKNPDIEKGFFFIRKREDYETQDKVFDYDYNNIYYQN